MQSAGEPVPLTVECSIIARRVKGAFASLRDRTSSTLDSPTYDLVRATIRGTGQVWSAVPWGVDRGSGSAPRSSASNA